LRLNSRKEINQIVNFTKDKLTDETGGTRKQQQSAQDTQSDQLKITNPSDDIRQIRVKLQNSDQFRSKAQVKVFCLEVDD